MAQTLCHNNEVSTEVHHAITRPPGFATRIFQLFFQRRSSSDDTRPRSWSERTPTTAKETLTRHASAQVVISSEFKPSARPPTHTLTRTTGSWRQEQTHCVNCSRLFFPLLSPFSSNAGQFCSLDCKTSFEYVNHLEEELIQHMMRDSDGNSNSLESTSNEGDYEVEVLDVDQLWPT